MTHIHDSNALRSQGYILIAEDLRKSYGLRPALRGLSFALKAGGVLGLLGPNGAGKTTAIRLLTTILEPSSGQFFVDGISSADPERIRRRIGVLPESQGFPRHLTGLEYLTFFGQHYGRTASEARTYGQALLEEAGLQQRAKSLIGTYSRGMRQRLGIARALVNDPVVVFLDEPTLGLDPWGQQELLSLVRRIARGRNTGVVFCSHHLSEIEAICDAVVILNSGRVVATGSVAEVIGAGRRDGIRILVPPASVPHAQQVLAPIPNVVKVTPTGQMADWLEVELVDPAGATSSDGHHVKNSLLEALIRADIPIRGFEAEGGRLQDVFLQLTERTAE